MAAFFALTLSIDALGVGFSAGLRGRRLGVLTYAVVFGISLGVMALSVFFGGILAGLISPAAAQLIAGVWIFLLGLWITAGVFRGLPTEDEPQKSRLGQSVALAFMLSIDAMGAGLAAAALGVNIAFLPIYVAAFQTGFLALGAAAARVLPFKKGTTLPTALSGVLLMALGIFALL